MVTFKKATPDENKTFKHQSTQTDFPSLGIHQPTPYELYQERYEPIFLKTDLSTEPLETCAVVASQSYGWYHRIAKKVMKWVFNDFRRVRIWWMSGSYHNPNKSVRVMIRKLYEYVKIEHNSWKSDMKEKDKVSNDASLVKVKKED